MFEFSMNSLNK